jgi:hypothetical protein
LQGLIAQLAEEQDLHLIEAAVEKMSLLKAPKKLIVGSLLPEGDDPRTDERIVDDAEQELSETTVSSREGAMWWSGLRCFFPLLLIVVFLGNAGAVDQSRDLKGEQTLKSEPLSEILDAMCEAGKQPLIHAVQPAGGLPSATIRVTGLNFGNDVRKVSVVMGNRDTQIGLGAISISKPDDQGVQTLVFAIPTAKEGNRETERDNEQFKQILGDSSICRHAILTLSVNGKTANYEHVNVLHPHGLWKIAGLSLGLVIILLSPLLAVLCWRVAVTSVLVLGSLLTFTLISDYGWILAVLFLSLALTLLFLSRAKQAALEPVLRTLFIDKDTNTYSLAKVQAFAWTIVIIGTYVYFAVGRGLLIGDFGIPDLSPGLLSLLSISYGGLILSRGISTKIHKNDFAPIPPQWTNLVTEGGAVSITRLQLLGFTISTIAVYLYYVSSTDLFAKGLPEIPLTLSGLMGISQGGYLGGKMVNNRAVNYIIPRRVRGKTTLRIYGSGFVDNAKLLIQGAAEARSVKFLSSTTLEVDLPDELGDVGLKQLIFIPPTDSSFVINDAFELIAPKILAADQLNEKRVIVTIGGIRLAEQEIRARIDGEPVRVIKKEDNQFTLESDVDLAPGAGGVLALKTADGDDIGSIPITKRQ